MGKSKWDEVVDVFQKWLYMPNSFPLEAVACTIISNVLPSRKPVWMFIVGPSSSGKNELLEAVDLDVVVKRSNFTSKSLISGWNTEQDKSLLGMIDGKILVVKDFTTIMSTNHQELVEILGILRDAYDGNTDKHFGHIGDVSHKCRFGLLAAVTHIIDRQSSVATQWGERFLKCRMPKIDQIKACIQAAKNSACVDEMKNELQEALTGYLEEKLKKCSDSKIAELSNNRIDHCANLANLTARLRCGVERHPYSGAPLHEPIPESGMRLTHQICTVSIAHDMVKRSTTKQFLSYVARSCVPRRTLRMCHILYEATENRKTCGLTMKNLVNNYEVPKNSAYEDLYDLTYLGIANVEKVAARPAYQVWKMSPDYMTAMDQTSFWSGYSNKQGV